MLDESGKGYGLGRVTDYVDGNPWNVTSLSPLNFTITYYNGEDIGSTSVYGLFFTHSFLPSLPIILFLHPFPLFQIPFFIHSLSPNYTFSSPYLSPNHTLYGVSCV